MRGVNDNMSVRYGLVGASFDMISPESHCHGAVPAPIRGSPIVLHNRVGDMTRF